MYEGLGSKPGLFCFGGKPERKTQNVDVEELRRVLIAPISSFYILRSAFK